MAGNTTFNNQAAFNFAMEIKKRWSMVWTIDTPFLAMIKAKSPKFNNQKYYRLEGLYMITPVGISDLTTTAITEQTSNQFTPITPYVTNGATQAQYYFATYKNAIYLTDQERTELVEGKTSFVSVMGYKIPQLMDSFRITLGKDAVGTQQDQGLTGTGQIMGEQYPLSTSASPGQIAQSSTTGWQAGVVTGAGTFNEMLVTNEIDRIGALGRGDADFCQLSYTSTNNVYAKFYSLVSSAQVLTREEDTAKFGFKSFEYRGLTCFRDNNLGTSTAGSMIVGRSSSWLANFKTEEPTLVSIEGSMRIPGTLSTEYMYNWKCATGIDDPAANTLLTGIT